MDKVLTPIVEKEKNSLSKLIKTIPYVCSEMEEIQRELNIFINQPNINITEIENETNQLENEGMDFIEAYLKLYESESTKQLLDLMGKYLTAAKNFEKAKLSVDIIVDVIQCGKYLIDYKKALEEDKYLTAVEILTEFREFMEYPTEGYESMNIYKKFHITTISLSEEIKLKLSDKWNELISWKETMSDKKRNILLVIKLDDSFETYELLHCLKMVNKLESKVEELAKFLQDRFFSVLITTECKLSKVSEHTFNITSQKNSQKPLFSEVLSNLKIFFTFLNHKLNIQYGTENEILFPLLGACVSSDFADFLIKECLVDTIPNSLKELENYEKITLEIEEFQNFLTAIDFFPKENFSILQYAKSIDIIFAEKTSQCFLENARTIMFKDLSNSMSVGLETLPESKHDWQDLPGEEVEILSQALPYNLFYFPCCLISNSAQELLDLVFEMMRQSSLCSDLCSQRLYLTTRLIFEMYIAIVPLHHEKFLETIPQYVALFHNNCMYLAHNLLMLGEKWIESVKDKENKYSITFLDLVTKIKNLGYRHMSFHLQIQRKQILDNIRSSDLASINTKDLLDSNAEQAVRQCLRQLQLLKNVWMAVLPSNVFTKLISCLSNMFIDEVIHRVCTVEDISAEIATQLSDIYTIIIKKLPNVFLDNNDVNNNVKSWIKLQELTFILGASLKDIEKRWNDGTGPLAIYFKNEEIRSLIKALFQNTEYRANLLSKLK